MCAPCTAASDAWVDAVHGGGYFWRRHSQDIRRRYDRLAPVADDFYDLVRVQLRLIRDNCLARHGEVSAVGEG